MIKNSMGFIFLAILLFVMILPNAACAQDDDSSRQILKQGLLGAGTGAIAAGTSGGKAGQGALIGAGTGVIGSVLLDAMTSPPRSQRRAAPARYQDQPDEEYYYEDEPEYYYEEPPQESSSSKIIKQGLLGAGTGAIASGASGGNAGQGALIGAGTGVIGGALLDAISQPAPQRRAYRKAPPRQRVVPQSVAPQNVQVQEVDAGPEGGRKKIVKKYDASGKLVSEEEIYF